MYELKLLRALPALVTFPPSYFTKIANDCVLIYQMFMMDTSYHRHVPQERSSSWVSHGILRSDVLKIVWYLRRQLLLIGLDLQK